MTLSIIVPVFNEAESLVELHRQIAQVASEHSLELDVVFVDDGSSDGSWSVIENLAATDTRVRGIRFRRNFGKAAALTAGIAAVQGETICMMDADLQDDPAEIPRFLEKLSQGFDLSTAGKRGVWIRGTRSIPARYSIGSLPG